MLHVDQCGAVFSRPC